MDGDPAVEPELDSFSLTLPLPYRVALVVVLGITPLLFLTDEILTVGRRLGVGRKSALSSSS
jgi:hypothetical protein